MGYKAVWTGKAPQSMGELQKEIAGRIFKKVGDIEPNPHPFLEKLTDIKCFKLRVGDYRCFIDIDEQKKELNILQVKHRKHAYD